MRKITSLTLVIAGFFELITSIVLYIIPSGRVAYWTDYRLLGLSKTQWGDIHITVGTLLIIMAAFHIYFNWRPIMAYIKNKAKQITIFTKSFNIALLIALYVVTGTLYSLPPMNYVLQLGEYFTDTANEKYGEPPYGHAELSSLKMFCSKMNIDLSKALDLLKSSGVKLDGSEEPIIEVAKKNKLTPQQLYDIIKPASVSQANSDTAFPANPSPNFGRKTIKEICQLYGMAITDVMTHLKEAGLTAQGDDTVKEIGTNNNTNPMVVFEILQSIARNKQNTSFTDL